MKIIERNNNISDKKILNYFENNNILVKELTDIFTNIQEWNIENIKDISKYILKYFDNVFKLYKRLLLENNEENFYIGNKKILNKNYNNITELLKDNNIDIDIDFLTFFKNKKTATTDLLPFLDKDIKKLVQKEKIKPINNFFNSLLKEYNNKILNDNNGLKTSSKKSKTRSTPFEYAITVSTILDKNNIYVLHKKHDKNKINQIQKLLQNIPFVKILEIDQDSNIDKIISTLKLIENLKINSKDIVFKFRKLGNYGNILGVAYKEQNLIAVEDTTSIIHEIGHLIDFQLQEKEEYKDIRKNIVNHFRNKIDINKLNPSKIDYYLNNNEIIARLIELYYYYKIEQNPVLTENFDDEDPKNYNKRLKLKEEELKEINNNSISSSFNNIYFNYKEWNKEDWELLEKYGHQFFVEQNLELTDSIKLKQDQIFNKINQKNNANIEYTTAKKSGIIPKNIISTYKNEYDLTKKLFSLINGIEKKIFKDNFLKGKPEKLLDKYPDNKELIIYNYYNYFVSLFYDNKNIIEYFNNENIQNLIINLIKKFPESINMFDNMNIYKNDKLSNISDFYKNLFIKDIPSINKKEFLKDFENLTINNDKFKEIKDYLNKNNFNKEEFNSLLKKQNLEENEIEKLNELINKNLFYINDIKKLKKKFPRLNNNEYYFPDPKKQEEFDKSNLILNMIYFPPGLKFSYYMKFLEKIENKLKEQDINSNPSL